MAYRKSLARKLRRNATDAENALWKMLRAYRMDGLKFRRQHPVGPFVVDLMCVDRRIIIEVDGGQHGEQCEADSSRSLYLRQEGYKVLRFWNDEILTKEETVLSVIWEALKCGTTSPSPSPPHRRRGDQHERHPTQ